MHKSLIPILLYNEKYPIIPGAAELPKYPTSTLVSRKDRLIPGCPYLLFDGPSNDSDNVVIVKPGKEAIFLKLPRNIYSVRWEIDGPEPCTTPQLYHINLSELLLFETYTTKGDLALLTESRGCFKIHGFNSLLVVYCPEDINLTLTISLVGPDNSLDEGDHCIIRQNNSIPAYTVTYDEITTLNTKLPAKWLEKTYAKLRKRDLERTREGCRVKPPLTLTDNNNNGNTCMISFEYNALSLYAFESYYWPTLVRKCAGGGNDFQITNSISFLDSMFGGWLLFARDGTVKLTINDISFLYSPEDSGIIVGPCNKSCTPDGNYCYFVGENARPYIIQIFKNNGDRPIVSINYSQIVGHQVMYDSDTTVEFDVTENTYYYLIIVNVGTYRMFGPSCLQVPVEIKGSFFLQYIR